MCNMYYVIYFNNYFSFTWHSLWRRFTVVKCEFVLKTLRQAYMCKTYFRRSLFMYVGRVCLRTFIVVYLIFYL